MPNADHTIPIAANTAYDPEQELMALAGQTFRMVAVTQALVASSRHVDVSGLQQHVGLLCAKSLDLPHGRNGLMRAELQRLASRLDLLHAAMRERAE